MQGILTTLSQSNGGYKYDYATVPFLAEVFKVLHNLLNPVGQVNSITVGCIDVINSLPLLLLRVQ